MDHTLVKTILSELKMIIIEGSKNMTAIIVIAVVAVVIGIFLEYQSN